MKGFSGLKELRTVPAGSEAIPMAIRPLLAQRWSFAVLMALRLFGVALGVSASPLWAAGAAEHPGASTATAQGIFLANARGVGLLGLASLCTGGLAAALFMVIDGFRYGLAVSVGHRDSGPGLAFPWLEFIAVGLLGALGASLFWTVWYGRTLPEWRQILTTCATTGALLAAGATVEASLLR